MHIDNRFNHVNCSYVMCPVVFIVCRMRFVILSIKYYYYYYYDDDDGSAPAGDDICWWTAAATLSLTLL